VRETRPAPLARRPLPTRGLRGQRRGRCFAVSRAADRRERLRGCGRAMAVEAAPPDAHTIEPTLSLVPFCAAGRRLCSVLGRSPPFGVRPLRGGYSGHWACCQQGRQKLPVSSHRSIQRSDQPRCAHRQCSATEVQQLRSSRLATRNALRIWFAFGNLVLRTLSKFFTCGTISDRPRPRLPPQIPIWHSSCVALVLHNH